MNDSEINISMKKVKSKTSFTFVASIVISLAVLGIYTQTATFDFVNFDDDQYVYENPHVTSGLTFSNCLWAFANVSHMCWQPLTWLSHMLDCQLAGLNAAWPHVNNMLLHLSNSLLLFLIFKSMTGAQWRSFFLALLFAIHPLGVDTVAWVSERKNLLAALFMLLSLWAYANYTLRKRAKFYLLAMMFFVAGLLSKPSVVTLPCLLLLLDIWPLRRILSQDGLREGLFSLRNLSRFASLVMEKAYFFALSAIYIVIFNFSLGQMGGGISLDTRPLSLRIANALVSYVHYFQDVIWPNNLAVYYPFPQAIPIWQSSSAGLFIIAITLSTIALLRRHPFLAVGWFWFVGMLVPVIGITQIGLWPARADRWVYVPMIGVMIMLVWGCGTLVEKLRLNPRLVGSILTAVIIVNAVAASLQTRHWRDSLTLFKRAVQVTQNNVVAHDNLGLALAMRGRFDEAFHHFREALKIDSSYWKAHQNLGAIYLINGDYENATLHLIKALAEKPRSARIHTNLGRVYERQGRIREAEASFQNALDLEPGNEKAIDNLKRLKTKLPEP